MDYVRPGHSECGVEKYQNYLFHDIKRVWDIILYSSLFLAAAALGMAYISCMIQDIVCSPAITAILPMVVFSVYNLNRKTDEAEDALNHASRFKITNSYSRPLFYLAIAAYLAALCIAAAHNAFALFVTSIPLVSGFFYSSPILPRSLGYSRLKEIPVGKNLVVSLAWGSAFSLVPVAISGLGPNSSTFIAFFLIFCWTFIASTLPDIRDRNGDAATGIVTIPVLMGVSRTRAFLTLFNAFSGITIIALAKGILASRVVGIIILSLLYSEGCIITIHTTGKDDLLCDVISDGQFLTIGLAGFFVNPGCVYQILPFCF